MESAPGYREPEDRGLEFVWLGFFYHTYTQECHAQAHFRRKTLSGTRYCLLIFYDVASTGANESSTQREPEKSPNWSIRHDRSTVYAISYHETCESKLRQVGTSGYTEAFSTTVSTAKLSLTQSISKM
jgi:hypothetical protein